MARATIRDVAREAKVSQGSVSRVLNGLPVSEKLRNRVEAAIDKLGYEPNALARSMRTRATGAIGCLVPDISNPLYAAIIHALDGLLQRQGYMLMLANPAVHGRTELDILAELNRRQVDGLVVAPGSETDERLRATLQRFNGPVVVMGRELGPEFDTVLMDYRTGTRQATEYLLGLGHRRIALMSALVDLWPGRERIAGLREAYTGAGLDTSGGEVWPQVLGMDAGEDARHKLSGPDRPTAVIAVGGRLLTGLIKASRALGLRIPEDLSVIAIGDTELAEVHEPPITVIHWRVEDVVGAIGQLLRTQLRAHQRAAPQRIPVETNLVVRDSCVPPPADDAAAQGSTDIPT